MAVGNCRRRAKFVICGLLCLFLTANPFSASAAGTFGADGQKASPDALKNGQLYYIQTQTFHNDGSTPKYLDVQYGQDVNGTIVQQYDFNGSDSQKWRLIDVGNGYYELQSALGSSSRLLDIRFGSADNGAALDIYDSNNTNSQKFKITYDQTKGTYFILTGVTGGQKSLDFYAGNSLSGTPLEQYNSNGTSAQQFVFQTASDIKQGTAKVTSASSIISGASYYIRPSGSGLYLTAQNGGDSDGTPISQEAYSSTADQLWILSDAGDGSYYVTSAGSFTGRHIDVPAGSSADWLRLQLYSANQTTSQRFKVKPNSDGTFTFLTGTSHFTKCIDIPYGSNAAGVCIQQYDSNGTSSQRFILEKLNSVLNTKPVDSADSIVSGTSYYIQSVYSKLFLTPGGSTSIDGTGIIQDRRGQSTQRWKLTKVSDKTYTITSASSGKAIDVQYATNANGTRVQLYSPNGSTAQNWIITQNGDGTFRIISSTYLLGLSSTNDQQQRVLDVNGMDSRPGELVHLWNPNGANGMSLANQKWYLIPVNNGQSGIPDTHGAITSSSGSTMDMSATFTGWSISGSNIKNVALYLDSTLSDGFLGYANFGQASADIASQYPGYTGNAAAGYAFSCMFTPAQLGMNAHTVYAVATGYDGATQISSIQLTPQLTMDNSLDNTNITNALSFHGTLKTDSVSDVSVYLNSMDDSHKLGAATVDNSAHSYTFSASGVLAKANLGTNYVIVAATQTGGSRSVISFRLNYPQPMIGITSPADGSNTSGNTLETTGYALNYSVKPSSVDILVDGQKTASASVNTANPDAADNFSRYPDSASSGFDTNVDITHYSAGSHSLTVQFTGDKGYVARQTIRFIIPSVSYEPINITFSNLLNDQIAVEEKDRGALSDDFKNQLSLAMNPTAALIQDSNSRFEFLNLKWIDGITTDDLNRMLTNCGALTGKGSVFWAAGKAAGVNPVYLVAHARWETGNGTSKLSCGLDSHGNFVGYYNMYGIGAIDSSAVSAGLATAEYYNWNSVNSAITGGADWIGRHYVNSIALNAGDGKSHYDQTTLYEMKWDPFGWSLGSGYEYATDFNSTTDNWAYGIAGIIENFHDIFNHTAQPVFLVPQYK